MPHWTLDSIDWARFDTAKVDSDLLAVVKTAALVEANAADYVAYLQSVFAGDADFMRDIEQWGAEERQHGAALARWAKLAEPGFDFAAALAAFQRGYHVPPGDAGSIRGSRAGELVARQVVETGTSSFYSALRDAAREPVLHDIARRIAADEYRHYALFAGHARRYAPLGRAEAARIALGRLAETGDDELGWAWYAANIAPGALCEPRRHARVHAALTARLYRRSHVDTAVRMLLRTVGLTPRGWLLHLAALLFRGAIRWRIAV